MEITHSTLEKLLKQTMDKLKFHLCLNSFTNDEYDVQLKDNLPYNAVLINGDIVTIRINTKLFVDVMLKHKSIYSTFTPNDFRKLLESCLRSIPKMRTTLTHQPIADILAYDYEASRFRRYTKQQYEHENPPHPYEKELHFNTDYRTTVTHWKSGIVVRDFGKTSEESAHNAKRRILMLLSDPEMYHRVDDKFIAVENHEDIIYDLVITAKLLTKEEVGKLINELRKNYES